MIPKIVHITWKTKDILSNESEMIQQGIANFARLNPEFEIKIYNDEEVDEYLKNILRDEDYQLIENVHIVAKTDLWRLFKLYFEGGVYMDIDRLCNKSISHLFDEDTKWILPVCRDYDFSHDLMITEAGNPVFLEVIKLYLTRRREGEKNIYFLGSQTYMHAITTYLFGTLINTNPGKELFEKMISEIEKIPVIKVVREDPHNNTLLYEGDADYEALKRDFYGKSGIKHWTGTW